MTNRNYILSALIMCALTAWSQTTDPTKALDMMADNYFMPNVRAAFGSFTFEYTDLPTPFARYIEEKLVGAAANSKRVQILNRNAAAAMDPAFRKEYDAFFKETGTAALLHGKYFVDGANVRIHLELTDLSSATLIGSADWLMPLAAIPAYASVKPADDARVRAFELARLGVENTNGLKVSVSTERGTGAAYRNGEQLVVLIATNKDAYVRLYHVDSAGTIKMIWPNSSSGGNGFIRTGSTVRIPGPDDKFFFNMEPPYGTDFLKAVASTIPFSVAQSDFTDLGKNAKTAMTRGLSVVPLGTPSSSATASSGLPEVSEALASFNIGP